MRNARVLFTLCALVLTAGCGAGRLSVWFVDPLIKVFPDDPPGIHEAGSGSCLVARNGHGSVQLALRPAAALKGVHVTVRASEKLKVQARRAGYVPVGSNPSGTPYDEIIRPAPALYPDPLFEDAAFDVPAGQTTPVWITVYAPADTPPGDYRGEVEFTAGGRTLKRLAFQVRVARAMVPPRQTLQVTNWLSLGEGRLGSYYRLDKNPDTYWTVLENIGRVMADHKQNVMLTPVFSLAKPSVEGGSIRYDFADLDRWVAVFEKAGVLGTIEGGHLLGRASGYQSGIVVPAYVIEQGKVVQKRLAPDDPRAESFLNSFLGALHAHLKEKSWVGRYIQHVHDEPHEHEAPVYNRYAQVIRRNMPGVPTIDAVSLQQDIGFFADVCDIWVPVLGSFDRLLPAIQAHVERGGQGWFYTCIGPQGRHLNRFIDLPLLKTRLLHWFNFRHNLTGYLHWGGSSWGPKPFQNVQTVLNDNTTLLPAGDNAIVYPDAARNTVLSSIRLEAMRDGIEDYELLVALSRKNPARARALAAAAIPNVSDYVRDVAGFRKLVQQLLEEQ